MKLSLPTIGLDGYIAIGLSVVAAACVALTVYAIHQAGKEAQWKADEPVISRLRSDVATCKADLSQRDVKLDEQNAEIARIKDEGEKRKRKAAEDMKAARAEAERYRQKAEKIAKARPGPDVCSSARSLIVETLAEER